jgi:calcineurin-like phosphoesterase family protein
MDILKIQPPDWVISDTHLGHANILNYCPWRKTWANNISEHDERIIEEWNRVVKPTDIVLHLGDFCLGPREKINYFRTKLSGRIVLVYGNHDRSRTAMLNAGFDKVEPGLQIAHNEFSVFCKHDPFSFSTNEANSNKLLLHGHCHGNPPNPNIHASILSKCMDCSMDSLGFIRPVSWLELFKVMESQIARLD